MITQQDNVLARIYVCILIKTLIIRNTPNEYNLFHSACIQQFKKLAKSYISIRRAEWLQLLASANTGRGGNLFLICSLFHLGCEQSKIVSDKYCVCQVSQALSIEPPTNSTRQPRPRYLSVYQIIRLFTDFLILSIKILVIVCM